MRKYAKMFAPVVVLLVWAWVLNWVDIGMIDPTAEVEAIWVAGGGVSFLIGIGFAASMYLFIQSVDQKRAGEKHE